MGRRPKKWDIHFHSYNNRWCVSDYKNWVNKIASFDLESLDNLPFRESKKYLKNPRWQTRNTPIDNYLMKQIGRDYDEVFSELKRLIPKKYQHQQCIDLSDYKMPTTFHPSVSRWFLKDYASSWAEPQDGFYVDLATNTLCFIEKIGKHKLQEEERKKPVYKPFEVERFKINNDYGQNYVFQQLLDYEAFEAEAAKMKHCVRTYFTWCTDTRMKRSIWSVTLGTTKVLTIELFHSSIIQVRGYANRRADDTEKAVIQKWANWVKLTISEYAL